jgi:hypothetical protein
LVCLGVNPRGTAATITVCGSCLSTERVGFANDGPTEGGGVRPWYAWCAVRASISLVASSFPLAVGCTRGSGEGVDEPAVGGGERLSGLFPGLAVEGNGDRGGGLGRAVASDAAVGFCFGGGTGGGGVTKRRCIKDGVWL